MWELSKAFHAGQICSFLVGISSTATKSTTQLAQNTGLVTFVLCVHRTNLFGEEVMLNVTVENIGELAVVECEGRIVQSEAAFKLREAVTSQEDRFGMTTSGILHGSAAFMLHAYFKPMLLSCLLSTS